MPTSLEEMAADPALVPRVYSYCDLWCTNCPMTGRCLVFRARPQWEAEHPPGTSSWITNAVEFTRAVGRADGHGTPELDHALEAHRAGRNPHRRHSVEDRDMEGLAYMYAVLSELFLRASDWTPPLDGNPPAAKPRPIDVVGWYHLQIFLRIARALDGAEVVAQGNRDRLTDMLSAAKVALIGIDRSRRALRMMATEAEGRGGDDMLQMLARLEGLVQARFPEARAFMRPGLDAPAV